MNLDSIKQHYVPQFYLRNFGEKIFGLDKKDSSIFETTPRRVAFKSNFYGPVIDGKQPLESVLSELEKEFSIAIREIIDKEDIHRISYENFRTFCRFVGLQYIRTDETRRKLEDAGNNLLHTMMRGKFPKLNDDIIKSSGLTDTGKLGIHLQLLKSYGTYAYIVSNMKFITILNRTEIPLWTSDNPVALRNECEQPPFSNLGPMCKGIEIHIPITPKLMIMACDPYYFLDLPSVVEEHNEDQITKENLLQMNWSTRFLFSNSNEFHKSHEMLSSAPELRNPDRQRSKLNQISGKDLIKKKLLVWPSQEILDAISKMDDKKKSATLKEDGKYLISSW